MSNTSKNNNNKDHEAPLNNTSPSTGRSGPQNYAPQMNGHNPNYNNKRYYNNNNGHYQSYGQHNPRQPSPGGPPPHIQQHGQQPPPIQPLPAGIQQVPQPQGRGGGGQKGTPHPYSPQSPLAPQQQPPPPQQLPQQLPPHQQSQQPPQPSPHKQPQPQSVINSAIPQRTLSAPPTLEESPSHHPHSKAPSNFVPQKTIPMGYAPQFPVPPNFKQQRAFHPAPPVPYGTEMYGMYTPNYYQQPGYVMPADQFYPGMIPTHMATPPQSVAKISPAPKKVLQIIDPTTKTSVNTSPPKQAPVTTNQSPPPFSLGSKNVRKKLQEKAEKEKAEKEKVESQASTPTTETSDNSSSTTTPSNENVVETPVSTTTTTSAAAPTTEEKKDSSSPVIKSTPAAVEEKETQVQQSSTKIAEPVAAATTEEKKEEIAPPSTSSSSSTALEEGEITEPAATTTLTQPPQEEEEEEEWEKKGDEPVNVPDNSSASPNNIIISSSGTNPFASRSSGGVIRYSHDEMWKLRPQHIDVRPDLKEIFAGASDSMQGKYGPQQGGKQGMNKSGGNISFFPPQPQGGKMMAKNPPFNKGLNQSGGNYPNQMGKYAQYTQSIQQQIYSHQQQQQQHTPQIPPHIHHQVPPVQLPVSENRWVPTKLSALNETQLQLRKTKFILNRLAPEMFDKLSKDLLDLGFTKQEEVFTGVIHQIFDKAITEAKYVTMYSNLCKKIFEYEKTEKEANRKARLESLEKQLADGEITEMPSMVTIEKEFKPAFRTLLLSTCQEEYEKIQKLFDNGEEAPPNLSQQELSDWEEKQFIQRKKFFGLIKFIAELFKQDMLSEKIIHAILVALMGELVKPQEIKLECFCKLLTPIGAKIASRKDPEVENFMKGYYQRMIQLLESPNLSQRIKFLIQNVLDLKDNGWKQKPEDAPKPAKEERNLEEERKQLTGVRTNAKNNMFASNMSFNRPLSTKVSTSLSTSPVTGNQPNKFATKPLAATPSAPIPSMQNIGNPWNAKKSPAVPRPNTPTTTATSSSSKESASSKAWEEIQNNLTDVIEEYLANKDQDEMVECIKQYVTSQEFYPQVIAFYLSQATEQSNPQVLTELVIYLVQGANIFSNNQLIQGFEKFIATLPDIFEERPAAYEQIGKICYQLINSQFISLAQFSSTLSQQVENIGGSNVSKILIEFIKTFNDTEKAVHAFNNADVSISTFYGQSTDRKTVTDTFDKANLSSSFLNKVKF